MKNFKNTFLGFCLGTAALGQAIGPRMMSVVKANDRQGEPQVLVTVDSKLACPAGFEVAWRPFQYGSNLRNNATPYSAHPFCKLNNNSKPHDNVVYWAALLNGSHQSDYTREFIKSAQQAESIIFSLIPGPQALIPGASAALELKERLIIDEAIQATEALKEFRRGLVAELDNFSSTGLKYGKFDQQSLSMLRAKITQWNSDIQGTSFAPIYMCSSYPE